MKVEFPDNDDVIVQRNDSTQSFSPCESTSVTQFIQVTAHRSSQEVEGLDRNVINEGWKTGRKVDIRVQMFCSS